MRPAALDAGVRDRKIKSVSRRGKYIRIHLDNSAEILVHLKMSGRLQIANSTDEPNPHAHIVFGLDKQEELRFHDPRKFGRIYLLPDTSAILGRLGPEPLEESFDLACFRERLAGRRARLKPMLLDQRIVAGLGNIYVDETLWTAKLHPLQTVDTLSDADISRLHLAIPYGTEQGCRSTRNKFSTAGYRDLTGNLGEMQGSLAVFRRHGQACPRCGTEIERLLVAQRGTHICRKCQPLPHRLQQSG